MLIFKIADLTIINNGGQNGSFYSVTWQICTAGILVLHLHRFSTFAPLFVSV